MIFNWLGNKSKYYKIIEPYFRNFSTIIDPMMGSASILFKTKNKKIIGNDTIKLIPKLLSDFDSFDKSYKCFIKVCEKFNNFRKKNDYYEFRKYWNEKYVNNNFDKKFLVETIILLKTCSNSVVRFNRKQYFNSGFRGIKNNENFFSDAQLRKYSDELQTIQINGEFYNSDVIDFLSNRQFDFANSIFVFDPPYMLALGAYDNFSYTHEKEENIYNFIKTNNANFLFFNILKRNDVIYNNFEKFSRDYNKIQLASKSTSGQNRNGTSNIEELLVTNLSI